MPSSLNWLDYSAADSRRMMDVIALLRETDARDELGIGAVRDGLSDHFFPGTSTVQTRTRYFFFIPWMYRELERKWTSALPLESRARKYEIRLIECLLGSGEQRGVIGRESRATLKRLPSNIYWQGMFRLGILLFDGTQQQYHRIAQAAMTAARAQDRGVEGDDAPDAAMPLWSASLPPAPEGFPDGAAFALTRAEAEYLRERIVIEAPHSLFAWFARRTGTAGHLIDLPAFWSDALRQQLPSPLASAVTHARNFAVLMHGAALCYNALVADRGCRERGEAEGATRWEEARDTYERELTEWRARCLELAPELASWRHSGFWSLLHEAGVRVSAGTRLFVTRWLDHTGHTPPEGLQHDPAVRALITARERALKGGNARLHSPGALEHWNGRSGADMLTFRWQAAQTVLTDLHDALQAHTP